MRASGKTARSASRKASQLPPLAYDHGRHPKRELYAEIYDPVTQAWFAALDRSHDRVQALLVDGRRRGLLSTLVAFNALCHALVDEVLQPGPATDKMVGVVRELRHSVLWVEHAPPEEDAATEDVLSSLQNDQAQYQPGRYRGADLSSVRVRVRARAAAPIGPQARTNVASQQATLREPCRAPR